MGLKTNEYGTAEIELAGVEGGSRVQLVRILVGLAMKERLAAMGLVPGTFFRVVRNEGRGRMIVEVKGTRIMVGRGLTNKIQVRIDE